MTLGMTPVVTAQLDDPYCLDGMHRWLANWQLRAQEAATLHTPTGAAAGSATTAEALRQFGIREYDEAGAALDDFATPRGGGTGPAHCLRELIDAGTVEYWRSVGAPFQPLLAPRLREFALREGLADAGQRFRPHPGRDLGV